MSTDKIYDFDEKSAARIMGVVPRTLRNWRKAGKIGFYRTPGGRVRYSIDQLIEVRTGGRVDAAFDPTFPPFAAQGSSTADAPVAIIPA